MIKLVTGFATVALALMASTTTVQADERLYLYTENFPPYNMSASGRAFEHGQEDIDGLCTELVVAALKQTNLDYRIKLRNWDYGYNRALSKENHGIFCTTYTEERAPLFKWVGPISPTKIEIIGKKKSGINISSDADLNKYRIGTVRDDIGELLLLGKGVSPKHIYRTNSSKTTAKMLIAGRIDLWAY